VVIIDTELLIIISALTVNCHCMCPKYFENATDRI